MIELISSVQLNSVQIQFSSDNGVQLTWRNLKAILKTLNISGPRNVQDNNFIATISNKLIYLFSRCWLLTNDMINFP